MSSRCLSAVLLLVMLAGCERETRRFTDAAPERHVLANAFEVARGKQLFTNFNCNGCHAKGGGGMGPPLMDRKWIYGGDPQTIFNTIAGGRPNGMPAFGAKLGKQEIWELVAYVRSMSGAIRLDVAPGRDDHMHAREPEAMRAHTP